MKYLILLFFFLCPYFLFAQKSAPPGTVQIVEGFYFDKTEVTNISWREYLSWIEHHGPGKDSEMYRNALPDTSVWQEKAFRITYLFHPAFEEYPVVGVSHLQAKEYCQWRTERVKEVMNLNKKAYENYPFSPESVSYRLPTKTEWELIARTGIDREARERASKKHQLPEKKLFNLKHLAHQNPAHQKAYGPAPSESHFPNSYGIFHMIGNVAEMVAEEGIAKGGSWIHPFEPNLPTKDFAYEKQENWLGFRCVCEISQP